MIRNIDLEEAVKILLSKTKVKDTEETNLLDSLERTLAADVCARINIPNFNSSPLDGYAVKAVDIKNALNDKPVKLKVIGKASAGNTFNDKDKINSKTAVRIMTGAMIPEGYDTIVKKEDTDDGLGFVNIYQTSKSYQNFIEIGRDVKKGEKVISKGIKITSSVVGMCAALGIEKLKVFKKPKIGIMSVGSELKDITEELEDGKIYNSNLYSIISYLLENNCIPVNLGIVEDDIEFISERIKNNINKCDMVISTGGASAGDYDLTNEVYENLGAKTLYWGVQTKPGKPSLAADYNGKLLIGLSGNPNSALITLETIVTPIIKKMIGINSFERKKVIGVMKDELKRTNNQRRFIRVRIEINKEDIEVYLSDKLKSGVLKSMIYNNGLIDIGPNVKSLKIDDKVEVILLD